MADLHVVTATAVIVEQQVSFTLVTLCQASGASAEQVHALVGEDLLRPVGSSPADWHFAGDALLQTRRSLRLARDLELNIAGVAVVMDLLAEIERLRSRLRRTPVAPAKA
jgi:chaperone modulatory protein CbpM